MMLAWLNQLQHARKRSVVFVAVLERNVDELNVATWQPQIEGNKTGRELPADKLTVREVRNLRPEPPRRGGSGD